MPVVFDLYMLHNTDSPHGYPYVGISADSKRIINICEEHIHILDTADTLFFESDYLPTYRSFELNLTTLDRLVNAYTGQESYRIIVRFNEVRHITLTYHSPTNEAPKDYDIFIGYPEKRAVQLIEDVYPLLKKVITEVYQ
ncbi:MAG: hypothetical protein V4450_12475 [Bacteroidota bacterium]